MPIEASSGRLLTRSARLKMFRFGTGNASSGSGLPARNWAIDV